MADLKGIIREIPDHPKPGILFYDLTPVFRDAVAFAEVVSALAVPFRGKGIDVVAGIEARGFVLAAPVALSLGAGLALVRKVGKLPWETEAESYDLEYGTGVLETHRDAVSPGNRVLVVDDVLATGGTAAAAGRLVGKLGGKVVAYAFLAELGFLNGRAPLGEGTEILSLVRYD